MPPPQQFALQSLTLPLFFSHNKRMSGLKSQRMGYSSGNHSYFTAYRLCTYPLFVTFHIIRCFTYARHATQLCVLVAWMKSFTKCMLVASQSPIANRVLVYPRLIWRNKIPRLVKKEAAATSIPTVSKNAMIWNTLRSARGGNGRWKGKSILNQTTSVVEVIAEISPCYGKPNQGRGNSAPVDFGVSEPLELSECGRILQGWEKVGVGWTFGTVLIWGAVGG